MRFPTDAMLEVSFSRLRNQISLVVGSSVSICRRIHRWWKSHSDISTYSTSTTERSYALRVCNIIFNNHHYCFEDLRLKQTKMLFHPYLFCNTSQLATESRSRNGCRKLILCCKSSHFFFASGKILPSGKEIRS